jgi:subtilisin family serine protease
VFVTAPGTDIAVLDLCRSARCKISSGTSYSAPIVAAMAGAAKAADPTITPEKFAELLKSTSTDAGDTGYDTTYGWGIIDMNAFADVTSPMETQKGDVTLDGNIDNVDLVTLARYLVKLESLTAEQLKAADMTGDGIVDNKDIVELARFLVRKK